MLKTKITPLALVLASLSAPATANLVISEYVEGSSYNKAVELFNNSTTPLSLDGYTLSLYSNGNTEANNTLDLTGELAANSTYVIVNGNASVELKEKADQLSAVTNFNGDDALVLTQGSTVIDSFGQRGVDPGSFWSEGGVQTQNKTLRRKETQLNGRTDADGAFNPSELWLQFDQDDFSDLGIFAGNSSPNPDPEPEPE
ncbi:MAG: putative extracellular nuclease, partial [Pseudoalteromonas tetraodonis]